MIKAARISEMLVKAHQSPWHYNPEDNHLHTHHPENFKLYLLNYYSSLHSEIQNTLYQES
jgi:hypothetical protein